MPRPIAGDPRSASSQGNDWILGPKTVWLLLGLCFVGVVTFWAGLRGPRTPMPQALWGGLSMGLGVWLLTVALVAISRSRAQRRAGPEDVGKDQSESS